MASQGTANYPYITKVTRGSEISPFGGQTLNTVDHQHKKSFRQGKTITNETHGIKNGRKLT